MPLKASIVRQFGKPAGLLGELAGQIMARRTSNRIRNARTVELMGLTPDMRVLEFGCGPGLALAACAQVVTAGHVVGVDHSPVMIRQAAARLERAGVRQRVELRSGGLELLEADTIEFDRIFSLNVVMFLPDMDAFFGAVRRNLRAGGQVFTTYQQRLDSDRPDAVQAMAADLEAIMARAGFRDNRRTEFLAGGKPAVCVAGTRRR